MNKTLKLIFNNWQEERAFGRAETLAYDYLQDIDNEVDVYHNPFRYAMNEMEERAFLAGFNAAVELKGLIDGKTV